MVRYNYIVLYMLEKPVGRCWLINNLFRPFRSAQTVERLKQRLYPYSRSSQTQHLIDTECITSWNVHISAYFLPVLPYMGLTACFKISDWYSDGLIVKQFNLKGGHGNEAIFMVVQVLRHRTDIPSPCGPSSSHTHRFSRNSAFEVLLTSYTLFSTARRSSFCIPFF